MLHKCDFTLGYKHQCGQCVNLAVDPPALHQRCKSLEITHYWHDQHIPIMHCTEYHPDAAHEVGDIVYYDKGIYQLQDQTKCLQLPNKWTPVATRYLGIFTNFHTNGGTCHHLKQQYTSMFKNLITASINLHQLQQLTSVFLSKFRYHVCIQPLTDEQLQTLQTGLYNMICKKTRLTKGRHTVINADNPHFGLNIPGI